MRGGSPLQSLFDRIVADTLSGEDPDPLDGEHLERLAADLFAAAPFRGRADHPWAIAELTASDATTAFAALTERGRFPLPVVVVEGVFGSEAEARRALGLD